jgi:ADP-heptose:LPS heptosyltransferase
MSFVDFLAAQLNAARIPSVPPVDLPWLDAPLEKFSLPPRYVTLIPGCSPHAPHKRWPAQRYADLANLFQTRQISCLIVGTHDDANAIAEIKKAAPHIIDLSGQTNLFELAGILRRAHGVIGNDTGPLHMAASVGAPTLALFGARSNPIWSKPPGERAAVIQCPILSNLGVDEVFAAFNVLLKHAEHKGR